MGYMVSLETARLVVLSLFIFLTGLVWFLPTIDKQNPCACLEVSFLNVGQGDAVYIRTPDNFEILIDGGRDTAVLRELAKLKSPFSRDIDLVVATHPDSDHIGGLVEVLRRYNIDNILLTENINDTSTSDAFFEAISKEGAEIINADAGQRFTVGASTTITIFSPQGDESNWDSNNASIVMKISYGETDILLSGDAPSGIENYIVNKYGNILNAEILKLGHHGSRTSTSDLFLATVSPDYVVVSAAVDSPYNHPHQEVMQKIFSRDIQSFHTGVDGTITFESDGEFIWAK